VRGREEQRDATTGLCTNSTNDIVKWQREHAMPTYALILFILAGCLDILGVILLTYQTFVSDPVLEAIEAARMASVENAETGAKST
jgi:hypothetical protein